MCPQLYEGFRMLVKACDHCSNWAGAACAVVTGCEHLAVVPVQDRPACPLSAVCQHELQSPGGCAVRRRGLVCVSALVHEGMDYDAAMEKEWSFHAMFYS